MQAWRWIPLTVGSGWSEGGGGGGGEGAEHEQRGDEVAKADCHGDATVGAPPCGRPAPERHRPRYAPRHGAAAAAAIPTDAALLCLDLARAPHRARHQLPMRWLRSTDADAAMQGTSGIRPRHRILLLLLPQGEWGKFGAGGKSK